MEKKLDKIIEQLGEMTLLLREIAKPPSVLLRVFNGVAMGAGILGILGVVDILRNWLEG